MCRVVEQISEKVIGGYLYDLTYRDKNRQIIVCATYVKTNGGSVIFADGEGSFIEINASNFIRIERIDPVRAASIINQWRNANTERLFEKESTIPALPQ